MSTLCNHKNSFCLQCNPEISENINQLREANKQLYECLLNVAHYFGAEDGDNMLDVIYAGLNKNTGDE